MKTLADYYIARNVKVIQRFNELKAEMTVRSAFAQVGEEIGISPHTVDRIIYSNGYAYAAEAHAIVNNQS